MPESIFNLTESRKLTTSNDMWTVTSLSGDSVMLLMAPSDDMNAKIQDWSV